MNLILNWVTVYSNDKSYQIHAKYSHWHAVLTGSVSMAKNGIFFLIPLRDNEIILSD